MEIHLPQGQLPLMRLVLARGIRYQAPAGIPVNEFLTQHLRLDADFIQNRIQTIFMEGQAVDRPEETRIIKPCSLGLSAAMPGLFGAAFRKEGQYRAMRRSYNAGRSGPDNSESGSTVPVTVKCFNQVAEAIGNDLLGRGVCMDAGDFLQFWNSQRSLLEPGCLGVWMDGAQIDPGQVADRLGETTGDVVLKTHAPG
ncbi:MAG: hypothetical protein KGY56_07070 [Desulfobacterales bacterium]|nr:hypothetical protein [Desulfobacterales bacterium]